jgi:FlaA1/EpsC-like NDP-sugar epimerase
MKGNVGMNLKNREDINWLKVRRICLLVILDILIINIAAFSALLVRFEFSMTLLKASGFLETFRAICVPNTILALLSFGIFGLYRSLWAFAGVDELIQMAKAVAVATMLQYVWLALSQNIVPRSYPFLYALLLLVLVSGVRFSYRFLRRERAAISRYKRRGERKRTMLIGAGSAGVMALREFKNSEHSANRVVCVIDDDESKHGNRIMNVPIVGGRNSIARNVDKYNVEEIVFAIPSMVNKEKREIMEICRQTGCKLKTLPAIFQLANGDVSIKQIRDVDITDLLGRETVNVDLNDITGYIEGETVLVTGGGGSIGSELCRQVAKSHAKTLIIFDIYENNAYDIQQELKRKYPELDLVVLIGSVRDRTRVFNIMDEYRPSLVFHAAAHKHVPLMEDSPAEAVKNNVFGTLNVAQAASEYGAKRFLLISTDKAVNPTSIMGASKRICEMIIQMMSTRSETEYVAVRFGNVLGSNGSVIPLFRKQILAGGPVTVTDKNVIRYFMTIPEAVSLVLQAGAYAKGGEVFVLDMGEPVRIDDLARNMIRLAGFEPDVDIKVEYTGLRPGEKLFEEILMAAEGMQKTPNNLIYIGHETELDVDEFEKKLMHLHSIDERDTELLREHIADMVPTFIGKSAAKSEAVKG